MLQKFSFEKTEIKGVLLIKPFVAYDERGYFLKDYSAEVFRENGIEHELKEVFYTKSYKGVIRAIHFQREKQQAKLVRCVMGRVYDICVDLRKDSKTFGRWVGYELSEENKNQLLIPEGCGHGYLVLENSIVSYKCDEKFYGEYDDGIIWSDKDINITWPLSEVEELIISDKDKKLQTFSTFITRYGGF
ncbi:MAG TPA: dTDP-4-dehydrorhamnose 3,5-epimerase [Clostridiales bacterium]|nr:dTDP-4-dehydrorhamnose 3,5-epimerase [Clostridiales bacterium]